MNDLDAKLEVFGEEICTLRTRYECRSLSDTEDSQARLLEQDTISLPSFGC